jgi:hypothetical protein
MLRSLATVGPLLLAADAAGATPPAGDGSTQESITVPIGRRVSGGSILQTRVDTHRCAANVVVITIAFDWNPPPRGFRSRITGITVDGRAVPQSQLIEINRLIGTFEQSPEIYPHCHDGQFRMSLSQVERTRLTRDETVPFTLDGR